MITLQEKPTLQETFDFIVGKLREQGEPALNESETCSYGKPGGKRCAIGHITPCPLDAVMTVDYLMAHGVIAESPNKTALKAIQRCHDMNAGLDLDVWRKSCSYQLTRVAENYGLDPKSAQEWRDSL